MSDFNRFGVVAADIVNLYPDISLTDLGGTAIVEAAIDRAVRRVVSQWPERVHRLFSYRVEHEILAGPAYGGEGPTFTLGLGPIATADVAKIVINRLSSNQDGTKPADCPSLTESNQTGTLGGTGNQTLTLTGSNTTLNRGEYLYISYEVDSSDSTFTLTSYGDYVVYAAGAELGGKLTDQETEGWKLVDRYEELAKEYLQGLVDGGFIDNSIRVMEFCKEVEPAGSSIKTIRKSRG